MRGRLVPLVVLSGLLAALPACHPPAIVDLPASGLDVTITVLDVTPTPSDGKVIVAAQFFSGGKVVQLGSAAAVTCNGIALLWNGLLSAHAERVPLVAVGGTYTVRHVRAAVTATATLVVPPRPVISLPLAGATVTRSANVMVTYVPASSAGVRASASDGSTASGGNVEPDNGNYTGLNASSLKAGPGTIGLTREITGTLTGTGFNSAKTSYTVGSLDIPVSWM
jgi:hypothetical protein